MIKTKQKQKKKKKKKIKERKTQWKEDHYSKTSHLINSQTGTPVIIYKMYIFEQ